jgi:hypothetical protein
MQGDMLLALWLVTSMPGGRLDLASFGTIKGWLTNSEAKVYPADRKGDWEAVQANGEADWHLGVEWDEPRQFREIEVRFRRDDLPREVIPEYWVSSWPPPEGRGGWTRTDSPWNGHWRPIKAVSEKLPDGLRFRFLPLDAEENPNAPHFSGTPPQWRQALKVRLRFRSPRPPRVTALRIYGTSRAAVREVSVETGCENKPPRPIELAIYNGFIPKVRQSGNTVRATVLYADHEAGSNDRTILSVRSADVRFGVALDDLMREKGIYVRDAGIFVGDATVGYDFATYLASGRMRPGKDIVSQVASSPEQTLERALAEIPALKMTNRSPYRYIPLGFVGNRHKYALLFNGNIFISKRESKLFGDELARMQWEGDRITWRIGAGEKPDFREREEAARQRMLDQELPVAITEWTHGPIHFSQEAFVTLVNSPLDPLSTRGDEYGVLLMKITGRNPTSRAQRTTLWLHVDPAETLSLSDGILRGEQGRFLAALRSPSGEITIAHLPPGADYQGQAVRWVVDIPPGQAVEWQIRISLFSVLEPAVLRDIASLDYEHERHRIINYWRRQLDQGMTLHVPDRLFNLFHRAALQHILLSVFRDPPSGLYMGPCGTLRYNMFANETAIQARLLNMRGLHDWAARFLEPFVARQGSKPFPGRFRDGSAIYHGVFFGPDRDYTHSGYNLNHGWTLWALAEHYLFSRDRAWFEARLPGMKKAADWIISERRATMRTGPSGDRVWEYGLLPPGQLEDNEEWQYWFAVNGYAYKGLKYFARALADVDPEASRRYAREAEAYRADIREAALRSMESSPVAALRDGTWTPTLPPRTHLHGRDVGWIRNILYGAIVLIDTEVFSPDEPVSEWILRDLEDNLFMAPWSFSVPESDWFSRGGITLQPNLVNTPMIYLERDQIPHALRAFYNTFAVSFYPDVIAFTEWVPSFGTSGGPFYKTSDEAAFLIWLRQLLVREIPDGLWIASGVPRRWLRHGERIEVRDAATYFGPVSFEIHSRIAEGLVEAHVELPESFRGSRVLLRVRHPDTRRIKQAQVNGAPTAFDADRELVFLPARPGKYTVRIDY